MLLRNIRLYLDPDELDWGQSDFLFKTCYLSHYLTRRLRELKWQTDDFKRIFVQGRKSDVAAPQVNTDGFLIAQVIMDQQRYESLDQPEYHEFFIEMILNGLEECAKHHHIPISELKSAIDDFRADGYRNEWTHKKRTFRPIGLQASLYCSLDMERFVLTLRVEQKNNVVFNAPILETKPDEIFFTHEFKDIILEGQTIIVTNKFNEPTFSLNLDTLIASE